MIENLLLISLLAAAAALSVYFRKLTSGAAALGLVFAISIFFATAYLGLAMMALFFLLATLATTISESGTRVTEIMQDHAPRNAAQVFANAGLAAIVSVACLFTLLPETQAVLLIAGSFVAATADTVSSEIGNRYGSRFLDLKTFKTGTRGENGVISFEGSFAGLFAGSIPAAVFVYASGEVRFFLVLITAGLLGNLTDSFLGAFLERKQQLNNNQVNFFMTVSGAIWAFLIDEILR